MLLHFAAFGTPARPKNTSAMTSRMPANCAQKAYRRISGRRWWFGFADAATSDPGATWRNLSFKKMKFKFSAAVALAVGGEIAIPET
jgi:hypothetical protein